MRRYWGFAASLILGAELRSSLAEACITLPQAYALSSSYPPRDGNEVPTDAPIVLTLVRLPNRPDLATDSLVPAARISEEGTGKPVPELTPAAWLGVGSDLVFAFNPGPLAPHTSYWYEFRNGDVLLYGGPLLTGSGPAEPLSLDAKLEVSYEVVSEPRMLCNPSLCGPPSCTPQEEVEVKKAHLVLPRARAGYSDLYARAQLSIAYDSLTDQPAFSQTLVAPTEHNEVATTLTLTMPPADGKAFKPCFSYSVTDASGHSATDIWCEDAPFPTPEAPPPDDVDTSPGGAPASAPGEPAVAPSPGKRTSQACALTAAGASKPDGALPALLALLALTRRRRSKSAL